jgi:hypothetical protein
MSFSTVLFCIERMDNLIKLFEFATPEEIEKELGLLEGTVLYDIFENKKFWSHEVRKSGTTWLITKREAYRVYYEEYSDVRIRNDWNSVMDYVYSVFEGDEELCTIAGKVHGGDSFAQTVANVTRNYLDDINSIFEYGAEPEFVEFMCIEHFIFVAAYYDYPEKYNEEVLRFDINISNSVRSK